MDRSSARGLPAFTLAVCLSCGAGAAVAATPRGAHVRADRLPPAVRTLAGGVLRVGDQKGKPFVVIDKKDASLFVSRRDGRLLGSTPVLLGSARGDASVPGIGHRKLSAIRASERTTPAGRFVAERGRNQNGEDIIWIDYNAAVSIHRLRPSKPAEHRAQRLATPTVADNRISLGCVNVPARFYDTVLAEAMRARSPVVYVLPETKPAAQVFPFLASAHAGARRQS